MITRRKMMRALFAASVGATLPSPASVVCPTEAARANHNEYDFEPVRKHILQAVSHDEATGVAIAVAHHGRIIWEEGFGWANRETGLKATAHTPFSLASLTKPFTTTTLMTLVAGGKLSLDVAANKYLRKSKIVGRNGDPEGATLRLLGAHAGGLPSMFEHYFRDESTQPPSADTLLREYGRLAYAPGVCYEYSNVGYSALGAVASSVTGMEFGSLMTRRLLEPLGLHDSFYDTNTARLRASAVRYDDSRKPIPYYTTSTPPSGELYASVHDVARFAMFNLKHRMEGQRQILDFRWIDELHKLAFKGASGTGTTFGWFLGQTKSGKQVIFKSGGQPGVATILYMVPSEGVACVALANRSSSNELAFSICDQILTLLVAEWSPPSESIAPSRSPFKATPEFLGRWEGTLSNGGANMQVRLAIKSSDSATLALGSRPAEKITDMRTEGTAFIGNAVGVIDSNDAIRNDATNLSLKLIPQPNKLVGRILATAENSGTSLPYVLTLNKALWLG